MSRIKRYCISAVKFVYLWIPELCGALIYKRSVWEKCATLECEIGQNQVAHQRIGDVKLLELERWMPFVEMTCMVACPELIGFCCIG